MKVMLTLSAILAIPFFILGGMLTILLFIDGNFLGPKVKGDVALIYMLILSVATAIIATTILMMIRYIPKINKLDEAEKDLRDEQKRYRIARQNYESLIIRISSTKD